MKFKVQSQYRVEQNAQGGVYSRVLPNLKLALFCSLALHTFRLPGQQAATNLSARFAPVPPCATLVSTAQTSQIPLEGIDALIPDSDLNPGDSITVLVTFFEKDARRTQWLLYLQVVAPDAKEQSATPPPPMTIYSSTGSKLKFASSPAWVSLRTLGPFAEAEPKRKPPKAQDKSDRFALNKGFLSLGFDRAAAVLMRVIQNMPKGTYAFQNNPFSEAQIARTRKLSETFQLTTDDERALASTGPALVSYFDIMERTSGLEDILFKLVDMPSVWSLVRQGGVQTHFQMKSKLIAVADTAGRGLYTTNAAYYFPLVLELNKHPALNITLLATAPQPPLLPCAGIVGLLAEKPGDKENYLALRIVSAHRSGKGRE